MARVQQDTNKQVKKPINSTKGNTSTKGKPEVVKSNVRKEPSKGEIMFFRIGMSVVALAIITVAIIFIIRAFMDNDEESPVFEDIIHITASDLNNLTSYDEGMGVYGDFTYFAGKTEYEDIFNLINSNDIIYIYFYRSSNLNQELVDIIENKDLEGIAFFLIDMDTQATQLEALSLPHLNLDLTKNNMLVTFNIGTQTFETVTRESFIKIDLGKI